MLRQHPFYQLGLVRQGAYKEYINKYFAICWNGLVLIGTLNGKNSVNYTRSAGKANILTQSSRGYWSASETIRKTSLIKTGQELTF